MSAPVSSLSGRHQKRGVTGIALAHQVFHAVCQGGACRIALDRSDHGFESVCQQELRILWEAPERPVAFLGQVHPEDPPDFFTEERASVKDGKRNQVSASDLHGTSPENLPDHIRLQVFYRSRGVEIYLGLSVDILLRVKFPIIEAPRGKVLGVDNNSSAGRY